MREMISRTMEVAMSQVMSLILWVASLGNSTRYLLPTEDSFHTILEEKCICQASVFFFYAEALHFVELFLSPQFRLLLTHSALFRRICSGIYFVIRESVP